MLKHACVWYDYQRRLPAAFRRLCVETVSSIADLSQESQPPSGGCVLKQDFAPLVWRQVVQPPSGGCVLKQTRKYQGKDGIEPSRLQAAVC